MSEADQVERKDDGHTGEKVYGLECPRCGCQHFHVLYTRRTVGKKLLRRRECRHCGRRLTTYESTG